MLNLKEKPLIFLLPVLVFFAGVQKIESKISSLSPWTFQERLPTLKGEIDQTIGLQAGISGVSPSGADINSSFTGFPYQMTYGLFDQIEIGTSWGLLWLDRKNKSDQFGVTDIVVAARYRFFEADRTERSAGLDVEVGLVLPTASFEKGLGTGGLGVLFNWGIVLPLDPVRAHFGMGFKLNTENSDNFKVGNIFSYNGGLSYPFRGFKDRLVFTGELKGFNRARNKLSGAQVSSAPDELYLAPGMIWKLNQNHRLSGSVLIGLTGDSSDIGFNLELQF